MSSRQTNISSSVSGLLHEFGQNGYWGCAAVVWGTGDGIEGSIVTGKITSHTDARDLREDDRFDLASLTKVIATAPALTLVWQADAIALDAYLGDWLSSKTPVTLHGLSLRQLVTHTSGLTNRKPKRDLQGEAAFTDWLDQVPHQEQLHFDYACINAVLVGMIAEATTGIRLNQIIDTHITGPLKLDGLRFGPIEHTDNIVPTRPSIQPGQIADEPARAVGWPLGNAGMFGSAIDVGRYASALLATYHGQSVGWSLTQRGVQWMFSRVSNACGVDRAVMWDCNSPKAPDLRPATASPDSVGHGGWNGHTLWVDPPADRFIVVLTNRTSMPEYHGPTHDQFMQTTNRARGTIASAVWEHMA